MLKFRRIRLADHRGRDATVLLVPVNESIKRRYQDTDGRPVRSIRRVRSISKTCADRLLERYSDPDELAKLLIDGDPEINLEMTGRTTGPCDRIHIDGDGQILYAPSIVEVRYGPLILERNGPKYRGFLDGRIQGDAMRLVLYLAAFELAVPEELL